MSPLTLFLIDDEDRRHPYNADDKTLGLIIMISKNVFINSIRTFLLKFRNIHRSTLGIFFYLPHLNTGFNLFKKPHYLSLRKGAIMYTQRKEKKYEKMFIFIPFASFKRWRADIEKGRVESVYWCFSFDLLSKK